MVATPDRLTRLGRGDGGYCARRGCRPDRVRLLGRLRRHRQRPLLGCQRPPRRREHFRPDRSQRDWQGGPSRDTAGQQGRVVGWFAWRRWLHTWWGRGLQGHRLGRLGWRRLGDRFGRRLEQWLRLDDRLFDDDRRWRYEWGHRHRE